MAPRGSLFLPDLPRLFAGEEQILSWFDLPIYTWSAPKIDDADASFWSEILFQERVQPLLSQNCPQFAKPSSAAQRRFEEVLRPINATPSKDVHHDLSQVRTDAERLSKELNLDEEQALRIVLLEWQNRPQWHLLSGYSEAEIASLCNVYGPRLELDAELTASTFVLRNEDDFVTETARIRRQVFIYFQECIGYTRTWLALQDPDLALKFGDKTSRILKTTLEPCVDVLVSLLDQFRHGPTWAVIDDDTTYVWATGILYQILYLMQVVIAAASASQAVKSQIVRKWFEVMADTAFLSGIEPSPLLPPQQVRNIESTTAAATLAIIDCLTTVSQLDTPDEIWLSDLETVSLVQEILFRASHEGPGQTFPATYAWAAILVNVHDRGRDVRARRDIPVAQKATDIATYDSATGKRSSIGGSMSQSKYEDIIDAVSLTADVPDPITSLIERTLEEGSVAQILATMSEPSTLDMVPSVHKDKLRFLQELTLLVSDTMPDQYGLTLLLPQFAILDQRFALDQESLDPFDACSLFIHYKELTGNIFEVAAARFPYEGLPFLRLCRMLSTAKIYHPEPAQWIVDRLRSLKSFTNMATDSFAQIHTTREDENANYVTLDQTAYAFPREARLLLTQGQNQQGFMIIQAGTEGVVIRQAISHDQPAVIKWEHRYSGLALIGEWLELYYNGKLDTVLSYFESASEVASEMILLLANLLVNSSSSQQETIVSQILEEASTHLTFGLDITRCIFDVLEQEMQAFRRRPSNTFETNVLSAAICFARAILKVRPSQFWHYIAKTSVVDFEGGSSLLYVVTSGVECASGSAPLTETTAELFSEMVGASLHRVVDPTFKENVASLHAGARHFEGLLTGMTYNMLETFESIPQWRVLPTQQGGRIVSTLSRTFTNILKLRYGVGSLTSKLTSCLNTSAEVVMARLRPETTEDAASGPIMSHLLAALELQPGFAAKQDHQTILQSLFMLANVVVSIASAKNLPEAGLELCLLDLAPALVRNLRCSGPQPSNETNHAHELLQSLLDILPNQKPVSLLGHLGSHSSIDLLNVVNTAQCSPVIAEATQAWQLTDLMISKNQQWLSVVILTGAVPEKQPQAQQNNKHAYRGYLMMQKALRMLKDIGELVESEDVLLIRPLLHFVATAQQNWSWTLNSSVQQDTLSALVRFATQQPPIPTLSQCERNHITALIVDLSSVYLQYAKSIRDVSLMKIFIPLLEWLIHNGIHIASYNASMHTNLAKNFPAKFGLSLEDFRISRRSLEPVHHYYDIDLANLVLNSNSAWKAAAKSSDQSYSSEVARADDNLLLVESEMALLRSFQNLCIEHASFFVQDHRIRKTVAHITQQCLVVNTKRYPSEQPFDSLLQSRAEMALALIQRLVEQQASGSDFRSLFIPAWECAIFRSASYDEAIANDDLQYWRTCLLIVLLAIQFHLGQGWKPLATSSVSAGDLLKHISSAVPQIIEMATVVIGQGLSTIVSTLQEQKQADMQNQPVVERVDVGLKDIALVLNMLETILRMGKLPDFSAQLTERLIAMSTPQSAMKLFMWSHLLAGPDTNNEPVHADIAARLLVSLSTLSGAAEDLAVDGVLSQLLTSRVIQVLQKVPGGVSNLDQRQHCLILYTIWSEGILPLCLNLLHAVRAPIAAEISNFLNAFPNQLSRVSKALRPRKGDFLTLSLAKELSTLSLLSFILDDYRAAGASAAVDPNSLLPMTGFDEHKKQIAEDLNEHIGMNKEILRTKIVPINEKEAEWHKSDRLTEMVVAEMKNAVACLMGGEGEREGESQS